MIETLYAIALITAVVFLIIIVICLSAIIIMSCVHSLHVQGMKARADSAEQQQRERLAQPAHDPILIQGYLEEGINAKLTPLPHEPHEWVEVQEQPRSDT